MICPPEHKHAEKTTCYVIHKCRCQPCTAARADRERWRNRQKAYGRYDNGLVDVEPAREHVALLMSYGMGWQRCAEVTGIGYTAMSQLIYGRKGSSKDPRKGETLKRISREKAQKILAVKPSLDLLRPGTRISSRGVRRRVQALVARGWSQSKLSAMVGVERSNWSRVMESDQVRVSLHIEIAELYSRLWNVEPPHAVWRDKISYARTIKYAQQHRWLPPLAWDDIDTDVEPPVVEDVGGVDEMAIDLAMHGEPVRLSSAERREAVTRLHAVKLNDREIARRLNLNDRTVLRIRQELGLPAAIGADKRVIAA